jgi:DNA-directed RNA polymerase specialized sigma24 family protein
MEDIDEIINEARDAREMKRAVSVKMSAQGFSPAQICQVLNVSLQYVSTRLGRFHAKPIRTESESRWHQYLGNLFTRIPARKESFSEQE